MGIKKVGGFIFKTFAPDHPPYHVHIHDDKGFLGRFDIENQRPMDRRLKISGKLKRALRQAGYLK